MIPAAVSLLTPMLRRTGGALVLAAALSLLTVSVAIAATRYAAPGGTGKDPCANPSRPCSVFTAADKNAPGTTIEAGDVVELAPGTYRAEDEGEFGEIAGILLPPGVTVRGEPGKARPAIVLRDNETGYGAFHVPGASEVADVAIHNRSGHGAAIDVSGGAMERVIARSTSKEPACYFQEGTIRSSACISSGGSPAIGINVATKGTFEGVIRNSTLVATGPGSVGMEFIYHAFKGGMTVDIDAAGVLIEGEEKDVVVKAWPLNKGQGAKARLELRNSSYETVETEAEAGGKAFVTRPEPAATSPRPRCSPKITCISCPARQRSTKARSTPIAPPSTSTRNPGRSAGWRTSAPTSSGPFQPRPTPLLSRSW